jgi:hypothetical protein
LLPGYPSSLQTFHESILTLANEIDTSPVELVFFLNISNSYSLFW